MAVLVAVLPVLACTGQSSSGPRAQTRPEAPAVGEGSTLAFDAGSRAVVLFGGRIGAAYLDTTWIWDGEHWRGNRVPGPTPRADAVAAPDANGDLILFGGESSAGTLTDTWIWHGGWRRANPTHVPETAGRQAIAYDAFSHSTLLVTAGRDSTSQTWAWDPDREDWMPKRPAPPLGSAYPVMVSDPLTGWVLLVTVGRAGGLPAIETWAWTGNGWKALSPQHAPTGAGPLLAYASSGPLLVAGGITWRWTGTDWAEQTAVRPLPTGTFAAMTGDPDLGRAGGALYLVADRGTGVASTWVWTGSRWIDFN